MEATSSPLPPAPSSQAGERAPRSSSLGRTSPRKQHVSRAVENANGAMGQPSTSTASPAGPGRGRGLPTRSSDSSQAPGRLANKALDAEMTADAGTVSAPETDIEDMEWQTTNRKQKGKKPVVPPK